MYISARFSFCQYKTQSTLLKLIFLHKIDSSQQSDRLSALISFTDDSLLITVDDHSDDFLRKIAYEKSLLVFKICFGSCAGVYQKYHYTCLESAILARAPHPLTKMILLDDMGIRLL